jgi:hypothetical protein
MSVTNEAPEWLMDPPPKRPEKRIDGKKVLGIRVDASLYKLTQQAAHHREISMSDHVRDVLQRSSEYWMKQPRPDD